MVAERRIGPGYQGSETSGVEVTLYTHGDDSVLQQPINGKYVFDGRSIHGSTPAVINVSTSKVLGAASGTFSVTIKPPHFQRGGNAFDLRRYVTDDDWIDIVFTRHGRCWHVMRGLVDRVQRSQAVDGRGATTETYTITGRDHGKIFETTEIWFNNYIGENLGGGPSLRAFAAAHAIFGNVAATVKAFMFAFLDQLGNFGRANWELPPGMPGIPNGAKFRNVVRYQSNGYADTPQRVSYKATFLNQEFGTLWGLGQTWSDPLFCELWVDLTQLDGTLLEPDTEISPDETAMTVVLRDRPFLTNATGQDLTTHPWFRLGTAVIPRQAIVRSDLGRGGEERYNAFFATSQLAQEHASEYVTLQQPLWDRASIARHGVRRMDPTTLYIAKDNDLVGTTKTQRAKIRDWHVLNPYYYSGTITLGHGRPDIRIGMRARIPGERRELDETYYVESVSHTWQLNQGIRTTLGVTHGWIGDDRSLIAALVAQQNRYVDAIPATAGASSGIDVLPPFTRAQTVSP